MSDPTTPRPMTPGNENGASPDPAQAEQPYLVKISLRRPPTDETPWVLADHAPLASEARSVRSRYPLRGPQVLIIGFAFIILAGTLLLKLPWASATGKSVTWIEALFTSTSATTVTGLVVLNTANDFSFFGQVIILLLLQVGGVGFIAFSVLLFKLIGRRVTLQERFIIQESIGATNVSGALQLALYVLAVTLALEASGATLLWLRWRSVLPDREALWYAIFHAISSYCNAGFDLFSGTDKGILFGFGTDWFSLTVMGTLILLGGFGITVLYDLWNYRRSRMLSLHTRLTLLLTILLTVIGVLVMLSDPKVHGEVLGHLPFGDRLSVTVFTVVSARTAGLTILPLDQLSEATQFILMIWMFVGGAPASMAGGVSISTAAVLLVAVITFTRGKTSAVAFQRTLPAETIAKAVAIMTVSTLLVASITLILSVAHEGDIFAAAFEVTSAFANAGYSLNFTGNLDTLGRLLIAFTMFWGRLGPLTIVVALAESAHPSMIEYPEEPVILG